MSGNLAPDVAVPTHRSQPAHSRAPSQGPSLRDAPSPLREDACASGAASPSSVASRLESLCRALAPSLPLPGRGRTIERWRAFFDVASVDLSLARLFEGHADALAILAELDHAALSDDEATWGVWAAEAKPRLQITSCHGKDVRLGGTKQWCSGAAFLTHALVTAWRGDDGPCLVAVPLHQPGIAVRRGGWVAIGMADSESFEVTFTDARGTVVGDAGEYLARPGFWHGAIGVAACWLGGAVALGEIARRHMPADGDAIRAYHLGTIDAALVQAGDVMRAAAARVDAHPAASARTPALRARWSVENAVDTVLRHAGHLLGASAYCRNATFARLAADLPVYVRQSHGEHDLAVIGAEAKGREPETWSL